MAEKMVASSNRLKAVTKAASMADTKGENWADSTARTRADSAAAYSAGSSAVSSAAMKVRYCYNSCSVVFTNEPQQLRGRIGDKGHIANHKKCFHTF